MGFIYLLLSACVFSVSAQTESYWHGKERQLRYTPEGDDFVIVNGDKKFNRALYGTNTAFRIETSDMPEFGFFMPNMGGNLQFGLIRGKNSLWLNNAEHVKSSYKPGSRIYEIKDSFIGNGTIVLSILAMADKEGMILRIETRNLPENVELISLFGGANNKGFSRNGDLGVDPPDAFILKAEACVGNDYSFDSQQFRLVYGQNTRSGDRHINGLFPENSVLKKGSPYAVKTPLELWNSSATNDCPVLVSKTPLKKTSVYYLVIEKGKNSQWKYSQLPETFEKAEEKRKSIAETVKIQTPDPYINPLGGVLSVAADGIWDDSTCVWQHGAVGWRIPLNGWRAAYVGDAIGWHERARVHFDNYAAAQITRVEPQIPHPAQDSALNLARAEKVWGTQMYSNGYITRNPNSTSRMHHYDMNLVYIDQLLWHFNWTGDMEYVRKMWPVLKRHLEWEKRNFDPDDDGLYDAYACIWASDALQYNSGGVTHSSAYNYRSNRMAAEIAEKIGEDPQPYKIEAEKIRKAIDTHLWLPGKGWWAEFRDFMGNKITHPNAGVWTIYHAIDSDIQTAFQAYQATRYVDMEIPHIPVLAKGLEDEGYQTISTTNWLPYSWSVNNVAFAEVAHTSLAYWQAGRADEAFKLFKSSVLDGMYLGSSPGNIGQVSFYDAARGECYRDFGDPIGIYSRVIVQGLFGILPDAMNNRLVIRPGFPSDWDFASINTPDIDIDYKQNEDTDSYTINNRLKQARNIELLIPARKEAILSISINNEEKDWELIENIGRPLIKINCRNSNRFEIKIKWAGNIPDTISYIPVETVNQQWKLTSNNKILEIYDPQKILKNEHLKPNELTGILQGESGHRTLFVRTEQGQMTWWQPVHIEIKKQIVQAEAFEIVNHSNEKPIYETINIDKYLNASVSQIFKNEYLSPRSPYTTLQIPKQGIGEWCHPQLTANIDDTGLRKAVKNNKFETPMGIPFRTTGEPEINNIAFTSLWDNYPEEIKIPLAGKGSHVYLLMAGSTNHMQSHIINGTISVKYEDGSQSVLELIPPETWVPIEQDFFFDGYAFRSDKIRPYRVAFKTGVVSRDMEKEMNIKPDEVYGRTIDGGAGIILDFPLDSKKELHSIEVKTIANEVIIGLMGITLQR